MNMSLGQLWDQLVASVCRPPRDVYQESELIGGRRCAFRYGETQETVSKYYRQDVTLTNPRGLKLQCSHFRPCIVPTADGLMPCVIYCHTNSGSRRDCEEILFSLLPKGITVFSLDFSGSGISEGDYVTLGAHEVEDLTVVVEYLRREGSCSTLGLWGRSMGAVTAILYAHRDPSIAALVVDSPFSKLVDLMLELATDQDQGLNIPRPLVKMALALMKRSVRKRAGFNIDDVTPIDLAPQVFVPALFGHAEGDTFVQPHHSKRLYDVYGGESKNLITFEGDHNSMRPDFWYDSALIFLLGAMGMDGTPLATGNLGNITSSTLIDTNTNTAAAGGGEAHVDGVAVSPVSDGLQPQAGGEDRLLHPDDEQVFVGRKSDNFDPSRTTLNIRSNVMVGGIDSEAFDEEAALQRALELSLLDVVQSSSSGTGPGTTTTATANVPGGQQLQSQFQGGDEEALLARAIAESLKFEEEKEKDHHHQHQERVREHARNEANAVRAVSHELHDALVSEVQQSKEVSGTTNIGNTSQNQQQEQGQTKELVDTPATTSTVPEKELKGRPSMNKDEELEDDDDDDKEQVLQKLREATARLTSPGN